jgi:septation ring formation regulator EzrA
MEVNDDLLLSIISQYEEHVKDMHAQNKDAKEEAKELCQQLDTLKRYLFAKICHMFS